MVEDDVRRASIASVTTADDIAAAAAATVAAGGAGGTPRQHWSLVRDRVIERKRVWKRRLSESGYLHADAVAAEVDTAIAAQLDEVLFVVVVVCVRFPS